MAEAEPDIECGFCLRRNEAMEDGRVLPCTHIHCLDCLTAFYDINHLIVCPVPTCGEVYTTAANNLPSHEDKKEEINEWCDVCTKKGGDNQPAEVYCTSCLKKYCSKHEELHDEVLSEHTKIKMEEYRPQTKKLEVKTCAIHKDEPYSFGCKVCFTVICNRCFSGLDLCKDKSSTHMMLPLDELVIALKEQVKEGEMEEREKKLEKLFKDTSRFGSAYDAKTAEMVQLLHHTRDAQIGVLKQNYDKLEKELVEERQRTKVKVAKFMEETVLNKWTELRNELLKMEAKYKHNHGVDIVKGFQDLDVLVQKLKNERPPFLELQSIMAIEKLGMRREIELGATLSCALIESEEGAALYPSLFKSPALVKTVNLPASSTSVCECEGSSYVGMNSGKVARIDCNYLANDFIQCTFGGVNSILPCKDRLYVLVHGSRSDFVGKYSMNGLLMKKVYHPNPNIRTWGGSNPNAFCWNTLTTVSEYILLPDQINRRVVVYSLGWEVVKHIPCSLLGSKGLAMCAVDGTSVVISDNESSLVFRMSLSTGEVIWGSKSVTQPEGITCMEGKYILVASRAKTVTVLNAHTGTAVGELSPKGLLDGSKMGLAVARNLLTVTNYEEKTVQYFWFRK